MNEKRRGHYNKRANTRDFFQYDFLGAADSSGGCALWLHTSDLETWKPHKQSHILSLLSPFSCLLSSLEYYGLINAKPDSTLQYSDVEVLCNYRPHGVKLLT